MDQNNLVVDSGVHPSLHLKYHQQLIHCKSNSNISYSHPAYQRLAWGYNKANIEKTERFIDMLYWENHFPNKNVVQQVSFT